MSFACASLLFRREAECSHAHVPASPRTTYQDLASNWLCPLPNMSLRALYFRDSPGAVSQKYMREVHSLQGLKPASFCWFYVRAEALTP